MEHRHLDYPAGTRIADLGAAALDDLLDRGDLEAWAALARAVREDPHGPVSDTVLRLCREHRMYGTSELWGSWIESLRAQRPDRTRESRSLRDLRQARGRTQHEIGNRMGITQSDVSKLERRSDLRLSTLRAYVAATGGRLELRVNYPREDDQTRLDLP